jgi:hypothetical protein
MGKATDITFMTVRNTGHGSSHYGVCEVCKQATPVVYCAELQRVYVRDNGEYYLSPAAAGIYGDMPCLLERYGTLRRDEDFARVAGTKRVTPAQFAELQKLHDNAELNGARRASDLSAELGAGD